jgi:AcrR family transcriptional regulator
MGRRSLVAERREQILQAAASCIGQHGVEGATQERIAAAAGMSRPHIRHYVGNRDDLLHAVWAETIAPYVDRVRAIRSEGSAGQRVDALLDYLFGPEFAYGDDDAVISAFLMASTTDERLRAAVYESYALLDAEMAGALRAAQPTVAEEQAAALAHALSCLAIGGSVLSALPFPENRRRELRSTAATLVDAVLPPW